MCASAGASLTLSPQSRAATLPAKGEMRGTGAGGGAPRPGGAGGGPTLPARRRRPQRPGQRLLPWGKASEGATGGGGGAAMRAAGP